MDSNLEALATSMGVMTNYYSWKGELRETNPEILIRVLQILGMDIDRVENAVEALHQRHRALWQELVPPCVVAWDSEPAPLRLRTPAATDGPFMAELTLESGEIRRIEGRLGDIAPMEHTEIDGQTYALRPLAIDIGVHGYHRVQVQVGDETGLCYILAAPLSAYRLEAGKRWGVFAPLYAMHRQGGGSMGDLGDLTRLSAWIKELGGDVVGTLPILASFLTEPLEYSPYVPVSRAFWNELYLDLPTAPGFELCAEARNICESTAFADEAASLRGQQLVDYRPQMALKRRVLEPLAEAAWQSDALRAQMQAFIDRKARVDDYAQFRAATEAHGKVWRDWPAPQRDGVLEAGDYDDRMRRYHLYVQFAMDSQLERLGREGGSTLYLDLPVGVHRYGYDTWRDRDSFAMAASTGAPPDALFSAGQNWGGAPLHPWRMRRDGYRDFIESVRTHATHAGMLRVDHVMGLHRMYWIPEGVSAEDGVYVHYEAGELYAILNLESHRQRCALTGEDLGTVPDYVRPSLARHGLSRLYVAQFALPDEVGGVVEPPPAAAVASINTHDMPSFAGFWRGRDIDDRKAMGLLDEAEAREEHQARRQQCAATVAFLREQGLLDPAQEEQLDAIMRGLSSYLAHGEAEIVILTLEDLWLEPDPQNVPGTLPDERPNWRRTMQKHFDEIVGDDRILSILQHVNQARKGTA